MIFTTKRKQRKVKKMKHNNDDAQVRNMLFIGYLLSETRNLLSFFCRFKSMWQVESGNTEIKFIHAFL